MRKVILFFGILLASLLYPVLISSQTKEAKSSAVSTLPIGYIDLQRILLLHPDTEPSMRELQKFQEERQRKLDEEIRGRELSPEEKDRISKVAERFEREIAEKDAELTGKIIRDIRNRVEKIAKNLNIQIVLDKEAVFFGGIDITENVIRELELTRK